MAGAVERAIHRWWGGVGEGWGVEGAPFHHWRGGWGAGTVLGKHIAMVPRDHIPHSPGPDSLGYPDSSMTHQQTSPLPVPPCNRLLTHHQISPLPCLTVLTSHLTALQLPSTTSSCAVQQSWSTGTLSWLSVYYPPTTGSYTCPKVSTAGMQQAWHDMQARHNKQ